MNTNRYSQLPTVVLIILSFFAGVFLTYLYTHSSQKTHEDEKKVVETRETGYEFINPLLECEQVDNLGDVKLETLKNEVSNIIDQHNQIEIGFYYRDLTNGPWLGINEEKTFSPQSLLKLPIALAYFKIAENNPDILERNLEYTEEYENKNVEPNLEVGQSYPTNILIHRMLAISDNISFYLLAKNLPIDFTKRVHRDLHLPYPEDSTPGDFISVKNYAAIFRVLYNSSYLSRKYSEMMLQLLSENIYEDGLRAGVPEDFIVANKYGVLNSSEHESQLHDCGIVYLPEKPYLLCIMTKGNDQDELTQVIQELSKTVFDEISKHN